MDMFYNSVHLHDEPWVGNIIVVCAVGVHQENIEGELGQGDVGVHVGVSLVHPLHLHLGSREFW